MLRKTIAVARENLLELHLSHIADDYLQEISIVQNYKEAKGVAVHKNRLE